ncbi:MAG: dihydrofolate reductase [Bacteroidales bacterium]|nr:dihydrofolate reductase [Bacteroidales bacterium]
MLQPQTAPSATDPWLVDRFADIKVLRYQIDGFDELAPRQRVLLYYLSRAALCGRDIVYDQNYAHNILIRRCLERIYASYTGDRRSEQWSALEVYLKRLWFANGIHHHYSTDKFAPTGLSKDFVAPMLRDVASPDEVRCVLSIMFDPSVAPRRMAQGAGFDMLAASACNLYHGVSQPEAEAFYAAMQRPGDPQPISVGLNSQLAKGPDGRLFERVWRVGGMYGHALERVVQWLVLAATVAESPLQQRTIKMLADFYRTGDLRTFDEYNMLWVSDTESKVDFVNGFIETYADPLGYKATWESVVSIRDDQATRRTQLLARHAQWFEDHSPIDPQFKKPHVTGVSAKAITLAQLGGDCYPASPLGINLPNADWLRQQHGSKSVSLTNVAHAHEQAALGSGFEQEFGLSPELIARAQRYGAMASRLHTDLHECLGHGSGQLAPGVRGDELKNYASTLEEARADLFALYYIADPKLQELGLVPSAELPRAEYDRYIRNGLMTQLVRIAPGACIEQAHMRNRQLIARWCLEHGQPEQVVELRQRGGKTYTIINNYDRLRDLFAQLLREVQRIKSTGDYASGRDLVERYAVRVDAQLHREVLARYAALGDAPYTGFVNPCIEPVRSASGLVVDARVDYSEGYAEQMMRYSQQFSYL